MEAQLAPSDALMFVNGFFPGFGESFLGLGRGCWICGQDRDGPLRVERAGSYEVTPSRSVMVRGRPADRSKASGCGSRLAGQAVPGV